MKFLFISQTGANLSLAQMVSQEGHFTTIASDSKLGSGIINQIPYTSNIKHCVTENSPDIIVFDDAKHGRNADVLRQRGLRTVMTSLWSKILQDPSYQQDLITTLGFKKWDGEQGLHFTIEGLFNGHKFIASMLSKVYTKMFPNDVGPSVISPGAVVWGKFNSGRLYDNTLKTIEKMLRKVTYRGPVSLNIVITADEFYVKSLKASPVRATITAFFEGTLQNVSDVLLSMASGENIPKIPLDSWILSTALSIPPWPYNEVITGTSIGELPQGVLKHFWFEDIRQSEKEYFCAGCSGLLGYVTARGTTIKEARRRVRRTINSLKTPNLQYRCDIGKDTIKQFQSLCNQKWIDYHKSLFPQSFKKKEVKHVRETG